MVHIHSQTSVHLAALGAHIDDAPQGLPLEIDHRLGGAGWGLGASIIRIAIVANILATASGFTRLGRIGFWWGLNRSTRRN